MCKDLPGDRRQKYTVRGFISTLPNKTGLVITSTRRESDKARVYAAQ